MILGCVVALLAIIDSGGGRFLTTATAYSTLQSFSTFSLVALGLGLTMLIGEFDLSVAGVFGLAGCVAVLTGQTNPWLGLACALAVGGSRSDSRKALIITAMKLGSVAVTLGGLLIASGLAYVITHNQTISYENIDLAMMLNDRIACVVLRSQPGLARRVHHRGGCLCCNPFGARSHCHGSDRKAAIIAGVSVRNLLLGAFTFSGVMAALGGALLSYGLASASPFWPFRCLGAVGGGGNSGRGIVIRRDWYATRYRRREY